MRDFEQPPKAARIIVIIGLVVVVVSLTVMAVMCVLAKIAFRREYDSDIIISSSPDGKYELVAREWGFGMGGGAEIYIRKSGQGKENNSSEEQYVGSANTDDGYPSFSRGNYYVEWENDKVTIYYYKDLLVEKISDRSTWRGVLRYEFE